MEILWFTLAWSPFWFIIMVVLSIAVMVKLGKGVGMLLLAFTLYNGMTWNAWMDWVPQLFWIAFIVGLGGVIFGLLKGGGRMFALWGAGIALFIAVILANSNVLGASPPMDRVKDNITSRFAQLDVQDETERVAREQADDLLNKRIAKLEAAQSDVAGK